VERAIRIHENIMARPQLSDEHRLERCSRWPRTISAPGLFDRAEVSFRQAGGDRDAARGGAALLLRIYEQQRDWDHAIAIHNA
jgi:lipopolysaccharide biosynthesis regulator YciM